MKKRKVGGNELWKVYFFPLVGWYCWSLSYVIGVALLWRWMALCFVLLCSVSLYPSRCIFVSFLY